MRTNAGKVWALKKEVMKDVHFERFCTWLEEIGRCGLNEVRRRGLNAMAGFVFDLWAACRGSADV